MDRSSAGLNEIYRLYMFVKCIPLLISALSELVRDGIASKEASNVNEIIQSKFIVPLESISTRFEMYCQLVEHVVDFDRLPDLYISPQHDAELAEIQSQMDSCHSQATKQLDEANKTWASFTEVKLEESTQYGFCFRSTKQDDERQLRASNSQVSIRKTNLIKNIKLCIRLRSFL